jgi:two-component system cell cycle response regulator DivK
MGALTQARILVAEDDDRSRQLMTDVLRDAGYSVVDVIDGTRALRELRRPQAVFDLVVLDMQMPGLDGMSIARAIREDPALRELSVLAVTAMSQPGDAVRVLEAGCDAYLSKPIAVKEVREMVAEMLHDAA